MIVASIVGSLREDSWNHRLSRLAVEVLRGQGVVVEEPSLAGLPLFNGDLDVSNPPPEVADFRQTLSAAGGLLISSPEFNHSIPAVLKNAIEWASRPPNAFTGKVAFVMGATPGRSGGIRMRNHLADCLECEGCWVVPRPLVLVPNVEQAIGRDGKLLDPALGETLALGLASLLESMARLGAGGSSL